MNINELGGEGKQTL